MRSRELEGQYSEFVDFYAKQFFPSPPGDLGAVTSSYFMGVLDALLEDILHWYPALSATLTPENYLSHLQTRINWQVMFYYRIANSLFRDSSDHECLPYLAALMKIITGAEVYYSTTIGPRFMVMHGAGVIVGPRNEIGSSFMIFQGATIGQQHDHSPGERAIIGDDVRVYAGAKVLGSLRIADRVLIGANSIVVSDLPCSGVYVGIPVRRIKPFPYPTSSS